MSNLDELERLLEHYGSIEGTPHQDDGHGGCVLCTVYVPHTDDEQIRVRYPCAFAALPALIAAARRTEALEQALRNVLDTEYTLTISGHDVECTLVRTTGAACSCGKNDAMRNAVAALAGEGAPR